MIIHTIHPDAIRPEEIRASSPLAGHKAEIAADSADAGSGNTPHTAVPADTEELSEAAKKFNHDVGEKLPPDIGSQEPL